jgi:hypothetical protein
MKTFSLRRSCGLAAGVSAVALALPALGQAVTTQTFTTSQSEFDAGTRNQGWWSPTLANQDSNDNYIVGNADPSFGPARNFFSFNLASACPASKVTLQLTRFDQTGTLTYSLWDVSTPAATLNNNAGASPTIFDDLGSGTSFGSFAVADGAETDVLSFPLNPAGVAAFNAARGGFFSVGGQTPGETSPPSYIYGFSGGPNGTQQLVATCLPTTTEECKNGGWRDFGVFKNQGDCVSFVATGGRNSPGGGGP